MTCETTTHFREDLQRYYVLLETIYIFFYFSYQLHAYGTFNGTSDDPQVAISQIQNSDGHMIVAMCYQAVNIY